MKPSFPTYPLTIAIFFMGMGCYMFTSPFLNIKISALATFMLFLGIYMFYYIEDSYKRIEIAGDQIRFIGFFSIRKQIFNTSDIQGYELHQKVHQHLGLHNEVQLFMANGKKIRLKKEAYSDYNKLEDVIEANFIILGYKPMQHAQLLGKWIPIIMAISGIMAGILGVVKILK